MFSIKKQLVGKFLLFISILFPYLMIPISDSLRSYMGYKILILIVAAITLIFLFISNGFKLNQDKLLFIFFLYCNISFLWGDNDYETFFIINIYLLVFLLTYLVARLSFFNFNFSNICIDNHLL